MISDALRAAIEHLLVDAPTESGDWCIVNDEGICSPTNIEVSTWTEIVDEDDDRVDEDDPVAVANGHEVTRVSVRRYDPGREESYDLPRDKRWLRFEALTEILAKQAADLARVTADRDRLRRACDEGLPRERIDCPACGLAHVEGPRHDDPSIDGRTRPHHTHRCYHCGHVWDAKRWSFGVAEGEETTVAPSEVDRLDDATRGALDDLARVRGEFDAMRAAVREYLAAIDEERALDVAAVTMPARWPDAYARAVDQRDAAHARVQVTEATLRRIAEPTSEDGR